MALGNNVERAPQRYGAPHVCSQDCECGHWRRYIRPAHMLGRRGRPSLDVYEEYSDQHSGEADDW